MRQANSFTGKPCSISASVPVTNRWRLVLHSFQFGSSKSVNQIEPEVNLCIRPCSGLPMNSILRCSHVVGEKQTGATITLASSQTAHIKNAHFASAIRSTHLLRQTEAAHNCTHMVLLLRCLVTCMAGWLVGWLAGLEEIRQLCKPLRLRSCRKSETVNASECELLLQMHD